jgi:S1-C subfamily serine protease
VTLLDLLLIAVLAAYAISGLRQGFLVSMFSLAGFLGGAGVAMWLLPSVVDRWDWAAGNTAVRAGLLVASVFVVASLGQSLALLAGQRIRDWAKLPLARAVDGVAGMVAVTVAASVLMWFVAGALRVGGPEPVSRAIANSSVLRVIDTVMPDRTSSLFASFRQVLDREGFPQVFQGISAEPIRPVAAPSAAVVHNPGVVAAGRSIVKITGVAQQCRQVQEGTGWVSSAGTVVTNAHVVAGLGQVSLQVRGTGPVTTGHVVLFDPERDLAVIDAPGVTAPALSIGSSLVRGDDAVVAGFPGGGGYAVGAARIRSEISATGADIYGRPGTVRRVYSVHAVVRPGNSGGPLLDASGHVAGVVFARSLDDPNTGYALTLDELRPVLTQAAGAHKGVSTGSCLVG